MYLYKVFPTLLNSYLSIFSVISLIVLLVFVNIHLSISVRFSNVYSSFLKFSMFIRTNLEAFHSLLIKFHVDDTFSSSYLKSIPKDELVVKKYLKESAPYCSMTSIGSTPFPSDFDIFLPCLSLINPWIKQSLNGLLPVNSKPWNVILFTQNGIIS